MDNLCHTLVGAALGEAGLKQRTRLGTATLMIAANAPDIDVLVFTMDTPSVAFRRGWTHGVLAQALLPIVVTGVMLAIAGSRRGRGEESARPMWLLTLSYIGVISHVLLDLLNTYGIRLLMPFERRWFYGDVLFIIDPWMWIILGAGVWVARRYARPSASRKALYLALLYIGAMTVSARIARGVVLEAWTEAHHAAPRALMVGPRPINPFERDIVVDVGDHYEFGTFAWPSRVTLSPSVVPKHDDDPRVPQARLAPNVRAFLVWSRFPFWTLEPVPGGTRVSVQDMRFPGQNPVRFTQTVLVPD